jgi:hypothetical protein
MEIFLKRFLIGNDKKHGGKNAQYLSCRAAGGKGG